METADSMETADPMEEAAELLGAPAYSPEPASADSHAGLARLQLKDDQWLQEATADPEEFAAMTVSQLATSEEEAAATYCHYLPVRIGGVSCRALVDSGNTWRTVISFDLAVTMGLKKRDLKPLPGPPVETASEGVNLEVMGVPKRALELEVPYLGRSFRCRPAVVKGLSMPANLSGPWLKMHGWDHLHTQDCLSIGGVKVPLAHSRAESQQSHQLYALSSVELEPRSAMVIKALAPSLANFMGRGEQEALWEGEGIGLMDEPAHAVTSEAAVVTLEKGGVTSVLVRNPYDLPVQVDKGRELGRVHIADGAAIHVIDQSSRGPYTRADKKEEYINQFVQAGKRGKDEGPPLVPADLKGRDPADLNMEERRRYLRAVFEIDKKPCLRTEREREAAVSVLAEFWDLFSHDGSYGHTHLLQHRIITEDVPPIKCRYRPINPALEPDLRRQLDEWLRHDVIEPANSPWSFNLVAAKKKGGKIRWCIDWRRLNQITKKDTFPMPSVQDTISRLAGSRIYSGVDMAGAFHCIDVDPRDREKTAFATPFGSFQQKRLGFGVTNGPATYCRLVDQVLKDIPDSVAISAAGLRRHQRAGDVLQAGRPGAEGHPGLRRHQLPRRRRHPQRRGGGPHP